jgi:hypothetical protein
MSPPSSRSNRKPSKRPAWSRQKDEDGEDTFLWVVGWLSRVYTALYTRRYKLFITISLRASDPTILHLDTMDITNMTNTAWLRIIITDPYHLTQALIFVPPFTTFFTSIRNCACSAFTSMPKHLLLTSHLDLPSTGKGKVVSVVN